MCSATARPIVPGNGPADPHLHFVFRVTDENIYAQDNNISDSIISNLVLQLVPAAGREGGWDDRAERAAHPLVGLLFVAGGTLRRAALAEGPALLAGRPWPCVRLSQVSAGRPGAARRHGDRL